MKIALGVEYFGAAYRGWQTQADGGTVQDALQAALATVAGAPIEVVAAGRTDAGVHATGQVVHFDPLVERPLSAWVRGVNTHLPDDVSVRWAVPVDAAFHARFCATSRRYRYYLLNRPTRPGLLARHVGWHFRPLDLQRMRSAAELLLGEHDFSAFRASLCQAKTPVKTLRRAEITQRGDYFVFDFEANAFLHHMVRNLVGSLVYVGMGRKPLEWLAEVLAARRRELAAPTFSAAGLYLVGVGYEAHWGLPPGSPNVFPWEAEEKECE
jgi:tRNA pseudouridine38-40 synthase